MGGAIVFERPYGNESDDIPPLYEFTWNHTTLWALKSDRSITYLQCLFNGPDYLDKIARTIATFGDETPMHLEFTRFDGHVAAFGLQLVRFTSEKRLYEIIGWRLRWSDSALVIRNRQPDAPWFGSEVELYADKRGPDVDELIKRIDKAAHAYPYANTYTLWPGPNSNTFTAWIGRAVPELGMDLPATAIGKDFTGTQVFLVVSQVVTTASSRSRPRCGSRSKS